MKDKPFFVLIPICSCLLIIFSSVKAFPEKQLRRQSIIQHGGVNSGPIKVLPKTPALQQLTFAPEERRLIQVRSSFGVSSSWSSSPNQLNHANRRNSINSLPSSTSPGSSQFASSSSSPPSNYNNQQQFYSRSNPRVLQLNRAIKKEVRITKPEGDFTSTPTGQTLLSMARRKNNAFSTLSLGDRRRIRGRGRDDGLLRRRRGRRSIRLSSGRRRPTTKTINNFSIIPRRSAQSPIPSITRSSRTINNSQSPSIKPKPTSSSSPSLYRTSPNIRPSIPSNHNDKETTHDNDKKASHPATFAISKNPSPSFHGMSSNVAFFPSNRPKESFKVLDRHTQNADFGLKEEGGIDGNRRRMWDLSPLMALLPNKAKTRLPMPIFKQVNVVNKAKPQQQGYPYPLTFNRGNERDRYEEAERTKSFQSIESKLTKIQSSLEDLSFQQQQKGRKEQDAVILYANQEQNDWIPMVELEGRSGGQREEEDYKVISRGNTEIIEEEDEPLAYEGSHPKLYYAKRTPLRTEFEPDFIVSPNNEGKPEESSKVGAGLKTEINQRRRVRVVKRKVARLN